ncbi:hypothetical protein [Enterobacter mori]|uniref:hypothetical protein n=1 Tax=Enterobacter mori TaxID=539813 RepID=UPI003B841636
MNHFIGFGSQHTTKKTPATDETLQDTDNFSLVLGGPLFQLFRRAGMADNALDLIRKRVMVISLLTWLPLFILAELDGDLLGDHVKLPFLMDIEVHIRFLVAVPLLILAELIVHRRLRPIARAFIDRKIIPEESVERFNEIIRSAFRLRNSVFIELLLIVLVYGLGIFVIWHRYIALQTTATWYAIPSSNGLSLTLAGYWYAYVSVPAFQFLLIRWYFRLFVWTRFLWQVSHIKLNLFPTHPDRAGGLGFLANTVYAFMALLAAHGAMLAAQFANRIFFTGANLMDFKAETGAMVAFLLCLVFAPLLVFTPQLANAKRTGLSEYGSLAERYVREFHSKWINGSEPQNETLIGSADIQSLADLSNSFEVVKSMRIVPITKDAIVRLAVAVIAPILPLALTIMSFEDLLQKLFGLVF